MIQEISQLVDYIQIHFPHLSMKAKVELVVGLVGNDI